MIHYAFYIFQSNARFIRVAIHPGILSLDPFWKITFQQGGKTKQSNLPYGWQFKCVCVRYTVNLVPFPAFSRSGRKILLPALISRSSFPVRELRSLISIPGFVNYIHNHQIHHSAISIVFFKCIFLENRPIDFDETCFAEKL